MEEIKKDYTENSDSIKTLSERDKIRTKISVYAGDATESGFHVLLREPVDNSIDEFNYLKDEAERNNKPVEFDTIKIKIDTRLNRAVVRDYGRGIPYVKDKAGLSTLEKTLTILHAGGKHENTSNYLLEENISSSTDNYQFSSGINGIGITLTNFASNFFAAVVYNEKKQEKAFMTFRDGYIENEATIVGLSDTLSFLSEEENKDLKRGTLIIYEPSVKQDDFDDDNVFEQDLTFNREIIINQFKILPYLNPGLRIDLQFDDEHIIFEKEDKFLNILAKENKNLVLEQSPYFQEYMVLGQNRVSATKRTFSLEEFIKLPYSERSKYKIKTSVFELAFNFIEGTSEPFQENTVNGSIRIKGGKQDTVWKNQIKTFINDYILENHKSIGLMENEDINSSLTFMFMVKINEPSFAGQTKEKLNNPELMSFGNYFFKKYLKYWINREDKDRMTKLIKILEANKKARLKSNQIREDVFKEVLNKSDDALLSNSTKLTKCKSKDPALCELFLVEGDSALGPVKDSRVVEYQAVLPLKGKLINSLKTKSVGGLLKNQEITNLVTALGCGIGEGYDYEKLKYNKIIILSDKDIDGLHIRNLNLIFIYRFYRDLIQKGHIYIVDSPLYAIKTTKETFYAWSIKERDEITATLGSSRYEITRYKGLGEMNPEQLYDTCLNKENRRLYQITLSDFEGLEEILDEENYENPELEHLIHVYMNDGKEEVEIRRKLIEEYYSEPKRNVINLSYPNN